MTGTKQNKKKNISGPAVHMTLSGADPGFCQGGWLAGPKNFGGFSRGVWAHAPPEKF